MNATHAVATGGFWRAYLVTTRPYLCFLSGVTGLVGLALHPSEHPPWLLLGAAFVALFASYGFGQALTDVFQVDTDSLSSPYRPLTRGLLRPRDVALVSLVGLALCGGVFVWASWLTVPLSLLGILGLLSYTPLKRRWWAGPLHNAWIVALLPPLGAAAAGVDPRTALGDPLLAAAMGSAFASYAVFVLLGYHKDVSADRASGYVTLPVRFGWSTSVAVSLGFTAAAGVASATLLLRAGVLTLAPPALAAAVGSSALGLVSLLWAHGLMLVERRETHAYRAITHCVRGYVLLHLGEVLALAPGLLLPAVVFLGLFELALATRPERTQI